MRRNLCLFVASVFALALATTSAQAHDPDEDNYKGWPFSLGFGGGAMLTTNSDLEANENIVFDASLSIRAGSWLSLGVQAGSNAGETSIWNFGFRGEAFVLGDNFALSPYFSAVVGSKVIDIDQEVPSEWVVLIRPGAGLVFRNPGSDLVIELTADYLDTEHLLEDPFSGFTNVAIRGRWIHNFGG